LIFWPLDNVLGWRQDRTNQKFDFVATRQQKITLPTDNQKFASSCRAM